jgi:predicted enzyme related to lactoylglutathione lyase
MPYTYAYGKICYLDIPATDKAASAEFYQKVFDWNIRYHGDDHEDPAFDDGLFEVSGRFVTDRPPARELGILISIMVDSVEEAMDKVVAAGGTIVQPIGADAPEITARFADPAGNVLGLYQEPNA